MTSIFFVRHAQPDFAWRDNRTRPLTKEGEQDCGHVLQFLAGRHIDAFYSSPYERSRNTIAPAARHFGKPIATDERLREREAGPHSNNHALFRKRWEDMDYHEPGGESIRMVQKRNVAALTDILRRHRGETVVVGTHGTALASILNHYTPPFGCDDFLRFINWMPYIIELDFESETPVGSTEHLYIEKEF